MIGIPHLRKKPMFRIESPRNRRCMLKAGSLGLGALATGLQNFPNIGLSDLLAAEAMANGVLQDRSVVFLFMHGGPPQTETFDPKMTAPSEYRCFNGDIATTLTGVRYGATMKKLAQLADKTTVVRNFQAGDAAHNLKPLVSRYSNETNLGSIYSRIAGVTDRRSGMPTNAMLFPKAIDEQFQPQTKAFGNFSNTGDLGSAYAPFVPSGAGDLLNNMKLKIDPDRLGDRRALLSELDHFKRKFDENAEIRGLDRFQQQAFDVILGGVTKAFDLKNESPEVIERYDTSRIVPPESISKRWNNHNNYRDHGQSLGKLMLLARRLCENGCKFVTVSTNFVWDFHADKNNATLNEGMRYVAEPYDHAVSTFIQDVEERGLSDKILLVTCGEMGRTPAINAKGGRDHWARLSPLLLHGGGLKMGQVIGRSDAVAGEPAGEPVGMTNLISTIMHSLVDITQLRLQNDIPTPLIRLLESGSPIPQLHS